MDFDQVFELLIESFREQNIDFALMGGFALRAVGLTRTTQDIDLVILKEDTEKAKDIMVRQGYELIHESEDILNFLNKNSDLGRVDFLLAYRKYALAMLRGASEKTLFDGKIKVKVLKVEDLVGLKVQSSSNDSNRLYQDMADIRLLIKHNLSTIDIKVLREYFALFDREKELDDLLKEIKNAK